MLPGQTKPPGERRGLSKEEVIEEEMQIFDQAVQLLCSYWKDKSYDGYDIMPRAVPYQHPPDMPEKYKDFKVLDTFGQASFKKITDDGSIQTKVHL
jgi:hypothetical protein